MLTPMPNSMPTDGSTINVFVDGVKLGNPIYNIYRSDLAKLFPGYANSNGAVGYFHLDTTGYSDGVHTIQWTARDDAGNADGIGSRYFMIQNTGKSRQQGLSGIASTTQSFGRSGYRREGQFSKGISQQAGLVTGTSTAVRIKTGYDQKTKPREIYPGKNGIITVKIRELDRVEIHFSSTLNLTSLPRNSQKFPPKSIENFSGPFLFSKNGRMKIKPVRDGLPTFRFFS
ncbi:MAG: hypothetical protein GY940_41315 [bacterium]|nr:hypothetical protein [bacterium]